MSLYTSRPFEAQDRALYYELAREFYQTGASLYTVSDENLKATFNEMLYSDRYAVGKLLEYDGQPAGFALFAKTFSQEAGGLVLWLEELYVRPTFRGKGIASAFLKQLVQNPPAGVRRLRLEVERENEAAVCLYESVGFSFLAYDQMVIEYAPNNG